MLRRLLLAASLACLFTAGAQAQTIDDILKKGKLLVGIDVTNPPYGNMGKTMEPEGLDVDVAKAMAKRLGVTLEIVQVTGPSRIPTLLNNRADVMIATFAPTPERALQVSFSSVYSDVQQVILAPESRSIKKVADTAGLKIGVVRGNTQDVAFTPIAPPGCTILRFDDDAGVMQALLSGQVDGMVTGSVTSAIIAKQNPDKKLEIKLAIRDNPLTIGVRRGQQDLLNWINTFIFYMKYSGELEALHKKYDIPYALPVL
ncbi:MAG: transporter substrate-binding domain-containing protein [Alphaproteobacteria bacterium]|nr:transporter substrate-binding domain-containing protein [Alphaproteobacteria bacterium]